MKTRLIKTGINFVFASAVTILALWLGLAGVNYLNNNQKGLIVQNLNFSPISVSATPTPAPATPTPKPAIKLLDKIKEGIALLEKSPTLKFETKKGNANILVRKQIALAILDPKTGEVFEKRVWVNEGEINDFKNTGVVSLSPDKVDDVLNIQAKQWNSFNSFFEIISSSSFAGEENKLVAVANKYLLASANLTSLPEKSSGKFTDIIYVPYSLSLHTEEIISSGKKYIDKIVDEAFAELDKKNVGSKSKPGNLATSVISKEFIKNIILIEHIDPDSYSVSIDNGRELAERMLVIIGANQGRSYRYTGSPAGARGLAQFIKPTYETVETSYPTAGLNKDYYLGMADHMNAVKAMVLFFDYYKADILKKINQPIIITEEILAAAYNGGPTPVVKSINQYGNACISAQLDLSREKQIFRPETIVYLKKIMAISSLKLF